MQTWTKCRKNIHTMNPHNRILSSFQIFNLSCLQLTALKLGSGDLLQVIDISISFLMFCRWYSVVDIAKIFVYLVTFRLQFVWKCCWHFLCNLFENVVDIGFAICLIMLLTFSLQAKKEEEERERRERREQRAVDRWNNSTLYSVFLDRLDNLISVFPYFVFCICAAVGQLRKWELSSIKARNCRSDTWTTVSLASSVQTSHSTPISYKKGQSMNSDHL